MYWTQTFHAFVATLVLTGCAHTEKNDSGNCQLDSLQGLKQEHLSKGKFYSSDFETAHDHRALIGSWIVVGYYTVKGEGTVWNQFKPQGFVRGPEGPTDFHYDADRDPPHPPFRAVSIFEGDRQEILAKYDCLTESNSCGYSILVNGILESQDGKKPGYLVRDEKDYVPNRSFRFFVKDHHFLLLNDSDREFLLLKSASCGEG